MSRAYHNYPVASTSYHQPPSDPASRRQPPTTATHRQPFTSAQPDFSQDIYIPESQEELSRVNIESRLLQPSGPRHNPDMRRADLTSASSSLDTYDRIGREDDFASASPAPIRQTRAPARSPHRFAADESLIPGVGRGVRSTIPSQTSYQERIRSLNLHADQHPSSPARSPYRPGKYSSAYATSSAKPPPTSASVRTNAAPQSRAAQVESESESDGDSPSDSGDSDGINVHTATFNSTGNHRNFAATPAGHTATMTANFRQRPTLGQDTLDRIEFDVYTDNESEHRIRNKDTAHQQQQQSKPRHDPHGPFASPHATNGFGINAADYQQHLASRTLTSPALRTLIGDRSKSPDSPTPAPSIDGVLHAGKSSRPQPRATRPSSVSAFEDLARRLQRDVELTRRDGNDDAEDGSASSGFAPGSQASSARTRVEVPLAPTGRKAFDAPQFNAHGFPAHHKTADATSPWGVRLPDVTGLTSALGSPVKTRDAVKHRPFDSAVGNQDARMDEIVNLRCFVDGIQVELDRAGERILNLEQAQEQQSHEFQGLRSEMQSALKDVRASQPATVPNEEQLMQMILHKMQLSGTDQSQQKRTVKTSTERADTRTSSEASVTEQRTSQQQVPQQQQQQQQQQQDRSQVEVVNRLYAELDKLRQAMEEQYRTAAGVGSAAAVQQGVDDRAHHSAYRHQDNFPAGRDRWDAIEALRLQVLSLAGEVESLNGLVIDHLVPAPGPAPARRERKRSARYEDAHPASEPPHPVRTAAYAQDDHHLRPRGTKARTDPFDPDSDAPYHRRVSFHHRAADDDEYDRTLDAVAENLRAQRGRRHEIDREEADISQLAESRAERASSRISPRTTAEHDMRVCTVCSATMRSKERKASRRARLLAAEQRRQAVELEESMLLDTLESASTRAVGQEQLETLRQMLREHWDEFLHQRMLYSELADELKAMEPAMGKAKRSILAQHVLEAVEMLELKADRIERLEKVLAAFGGAAGKENERERRDAPSPVRKEPGSRNVSAGSSTGAGANRLKQAMESFERRSRATGRNTPPTTIQL